MNTYARSLNCVYAKHKIIQQKDRGSHSSIWVSSIPLCTELVYFLDDALEGITVQRISEYCVECIHLHNLSVLDAPRSTHLGVPKERWVSSLKHHDSVKVARVDVRNTVIAQRCLETTRQ